jgi:hypothetical protein
MVPRWDPCQHHLPPAALAHKYESHQDHKKGWPWLVDGFSGEAWDPLRKECTQKQHVITFTVCITDLYMQSHWWY